MLSKKAFLIFLNTLFFVSCQAAPSSPIISSTPTVTSTIPSTANPTTTTPTTSKPSPSSTSSTPKVIHSVKFVNLDGKILSSKEIQDGQKAVFDKDKPSYSDDSNVTYSFTGWDKDLNTQIHGDITFTAQYSMKYSGFDATYDDILKGFDIKIQKDFDKSVFLIPDTFTTKEKKDAPIVKVSKNYLPKKTIKKLVIGNNVVQLENSVFEGFSELQEVTLGKKLKDIPAYCFQNDMKLTTVNNFDQIENFGSGSFSGTGLTSVTLGKNVKSYQTTLYGENRESTNIFASCMNLETVTIENTLPVVSGMFENCENLKTVTLTNASSIEDHAFFECPKLTTITLGKTIKSIGGFAFSENTSLASITLPEGLESIGDFAFDQTAILNLTIPSSVTTIGRYILDGQKEVSKVTIQVQRKESEIPSTFDKDWNKNYDANVPYKTIYLK